MQPNTVAEQKEQKRGQERDRMICCQSNRNRQYGGGKNKSGFNISLLELQLN